MDPIMLLIAVLAIAIGVGMLVQPAMYKKILDGYAARPSVRVVTSMLLVTSERYAFKPQLKSCSFNPEVFRAAKLKSLEGKFLLIVLS